MVPGNALRETSRGAADQSSGTIAAAVSTVVIIQGVVAAVLLRRTGQGRPPARASA